LRARRIFFSELIAFEEDSSFERLRLRAFDEVIFEIERLEDGIEAVEERDPVIEFAFR
jgi:hypothetical protein